MIVIPCFNGYWHLDKLIKSLEMFGTDEHRVVIVDTHSTDMVTKQYLKSLKSDKLDISIIPAIEGYGYESAAAITALREFPEEEKIMLIHDSCEATSDQWLKQFEEKLTPEKGAVAWLKFQPCLFCCGPAHIEYIDKVCGGHDNVPDSGIFGGIFYTYASILKKWDEDGRFEHPATCKVHSEAWERVWAILFHLYGYEIDHINWGFNPQAIHAGIYPHFKKRFGGR